ncbi:hypothetical protein [Bradyrhizobium roseum]|uniref:hypothetical protein n=1 Tax=Bradyrhizobium roseum TaxID=3056648 RepID=UPI0026362BFE|nr:hypothetical protein [Bradyrhizobium roseus]WKA26974.1 hypothetical protein QUH67_25840 [Bradyrhizobium roseus]
MHASRRDRRFHAAGVGVLVTVLTGWLVVSMFAVTRQGTWADEAGYIIKSWWYVSGEVKPYTAEDATWYQPLLFYWLGAWQWIAGHDIVASRALSLLITSVNIALLSAFLGRLGCTIWPIALAVIVFALTEDGIFYFNSATPYTYAVCLQLIALHLLLSMDKRASYALAIGLGVVLTMIYQLRVNLVSFIALSLAIAWVRAGRDRWRVYIIASATFLVTWGTLAWLWGSRFVYVSIWVPLVTDWLMNAGILPRLFPNAFGFSHQVAIEQKNSLIELLVYAFGWEMWRDWMLGHHLLPMVAVVLAAIVALLPRITNRGWIMLFVAAYCGLLVFHHLGSQSYCPICIQSYANYFDYLGALAGGLAIHGLLRHFSFALAARGLAVVAIVAAVVTAAMQSWSLTGTNRLPSLRNSVDALPQEVSEISAMLTQSLQPGSSFGVVGLDPRIPLALARADMRFPAVSLSLGSSYRQLKPNLTAEQEAQTIKELDELSVWTDTTAKRWIESDYDWLVVQRRPDKFPPWLIWSPQAPLVKTGLEKCFEKTTTRDYDTFTPPLVIELYKRVRRGSACLGE